jgi:hypothetical protein
MGKRSSVIYPFMLMNAGAKAGRGETARGEEKKRGARPKSIRLNVDLSTIPARDETRAGG